METLRKRADFLATAKGNTARSGGFVLQARRRGGAEPARIGYTVSRKVGNAVERNRVRRRLREAVRTSAAGRMRPGYDYVLIGRRPALALGFEQMVADLDRAVRRVHAPQSKMNRSANQGRKPQPPRESGGTSQ